MKILFITNTLPPVVDGVGDYTYNIARQFAAHKHEVYIVCKKNQEINTDIEGITVLPIVEKWNFNCHTPIVKLIKEKGIDIVSLQYVPHGFHPKGLPFPLIKLTNEIKKCHVKLFTFCHEVYVEEEKGNIKRTVLSKLMQYISRRIVNNSDYVATSIEYYKNMILRLSPANKDIPTIPIASNIPESSLSEAELANLKKELTPNNEKIISFFGLRNIQTSIDAISELKQEGYRLKVMLIGKTSKNLPDNLPVDTIKTGTLDTKEIDKYFKVSDIFILPQDNIYGCSFKSGSFVTGLRNSLPVITAKGKMTADVLVNEKNIMFTDFDCRNEVKNSILFLLNNKDIAVNIGNLAYNVSKCLTWEETYNKYIGLMR